ncbi:MAG: ABC transporter substrate-binding protein, partial [Pseudomonadota bacterium]
MLIFIGCSIKSSEKISNSLYVRLKRNPTTLDPALIVDLDGARIAAKIYSGLVNFDENLAPAPDIAASWTISSDGLTYIFTLRKGIRFFNGREISAADVVYSFERVLDPHTRSPRTWVLSRIKGARQFLAGEAPQVTGLQVRGPYELAITLEEPFAPFINFLGLTTAYIVLREEVEKWGADFG